MHKMGRLLLSNQLVMGEKEIVTKRSLALYRAFYEAFNKYVLTVIADWLDAGHTSLDHLTGSQGWTQPPSATTKN